VPDTVTNHQHIII